MLSKLDGLRSVKSSLDHAEVILRDLIKNHSDLENVHVMTDDLINEVRYLLTEAIAEKEKEDEQIDDEEND